MKRSVPTSLRSDRTAKRAATSLSAHGSVPKSEQITFESEGEISFKNPLIRNECLFILPATKQDFPVVRDSLNNFESRIKWAKPYCDKLRQSALKSVQKIHSGLLEKLESFVTRSSARHHEFVRSEVLSTGLVFRGANVPEYGDLFESIHERVSQENCVAYLRPSQCGRSIDLSLKELMSCFVRGQSPKCLTQELPRHLLEAQDACRKVSRPLAMLDKWLEIVYPLLCIGRATQSPSSPRPALVVLVEGCDEWDSLVFRQLVSILSHRMRYPWILVVGLSAIEGFHQKLTSTELSVLSVTPFRTHSASDSLRLLLKETIWPMQSFMQLGPNTYLYLSDTFWSRELSVLVFVSQLKAAWFCHVKRNPYCQLADPILRTELLNSFPEEDLNMLESFPSVRGRSHQRVPERNREDKISSLLGYFEQLDEFYERQKLLLDMYANFFVDLHPTIPAGVLVDDFFASSMPVAVRNRFSASLAVWRNRTSALVHAPNILQKFILWLKLYLDLYSYRIAQQILVDGERVFDGIGISWSGVGIQWNTTGELVESKKRSNTISTHRFDDVYFWLEEFFTATMERPTAQPMHEVVYFDDIDSLAVEFNVLPAVRFLKDPTPDLSDLIPIAFQELTAEVRLLHQYIVGNAKSRTMISEYLKWRSSVLEADTSGVYLCAKDRQLLLQKGGMIVEAEEVNRSKRKKIGNISASPELYDRIQKALSELEYTGWIRRSKMSKRDQFLNLAPPDHLAELSRTKFGIHF